MFEKHIQTYENHLITFEKHENIWKSYNNKCKPYKNIITKTKRGNKTDNKETFKLRHKTVLPITENKIKDTRMGQKEVWTAKKGLINIKVF